MAAVKIYKLKIKKYEKTDLKDAVMIWNQVVEDGVAFPQTEPLTEETGHTFLKSSLSPGSLMMSGPGRLWGSISCIRIISGAAGISVMPAMQCGLT